MNCQARRRIGGFGSSRDLQVLHIIFFYDFLQFYGRKIEHCLQKNNPNWCALVHPVLPVWQRDSGVTCVETQQTVVVLCSFILSLIW